MRRALTIGTPTGPFALIEREDAIVASHWGGDSQAQSALLQCAAAQIEAYFARELTDFDLPIEIYGSDFQRSVCAAMAAIPFGETRTYGELAKELGVPAQAIGGACGGNPIPLIVPCHRVLGASGLGGFSGAGGVETKVALLKHEGAASLLI